MKKSILILCFVLATTSMMFGDITILTEGFETGNTSGSAPVGWTVEASGWEAGTGSMSYSREPHSGDWYAYLRYGKENWMFKSVSLTAGVTYDFSLWVKQDATSGCDLKVSYGSSDNSASMTTDIVTTTAIGNSWQQLTGTISPATTGTFYIGVFGDLTYSPWYVCVDDILITEPEAGAPGYPTNPSPADDATDVAISGTLTWDFGANTDTYDLWFGSAGAMVQEVTGAAATTGSYSFSGLDGVTEYEWQVISHNSADASNNGPVWSFTTLVLPVTSYPYTEDFDGTWLGTPPAPLAWQVIDNDADSYTWSQSSTYITPHSGLWTAHGMGNNDDYLITRQLNLTGNYRMKWWDVVESSSYNNTYDVLVSTTTNEIASFTDNLGTFDCANTTWTEHTLDLSSYSGQTIYVAFHQTYSASTYYGFGIDDFLVEEIPSNPVFVVSPTSNDFGTVNINQTSDAQTFAISNTGGGTLTIDSVGLTGDNADQFSLTDANSYAIDLGAGESITVDVAFAPTSAGAKTANLHIVDALTETAHDVALTGDGWDPNSGGGGAAQGNYYFANSQASGAPSAPVYNWIDISTTGTEVYADLSGGDGFAGGAEGYDIGFDFNFFGVNYDKFWIAADGFISLGSDHDAYTNQNIPSTATPNNLIALFWDDLNPSSMPGTSYLYYQSVDGKLIVTYDHFYNYSSATATKWFTGQVILYQNGNIKLQYKEKGADLVQNSCTVGIENADGTQGINYLYNGVGGEIYPSAKAGEIAIAFGQDEGALPVTLTSFTATVAQETTANIQWTVESESGLVGYYVYRSDSDLLHASAISDLIQADNTPFSHSYSFVDDELEYEHTYNYWLESVASDGSTNQWGPQQIVLEGAPAPQLPEVTALGNNYPNPFNPVTVLKLNVKENEEGKLEIFNAKGQVVLKKTFAPGYHEYQWDAQGNASGLYFYRLSSPSYKAVKKMMLLK